MKVTNLHDWRFLVGFAEFASLLNSARTPENRNKLKQSCLKIARMPAVGPRNEGARAAAKAALGMS